MTSGPCAERQACPGLAGVGGLYLGPTEVRIPPYSFLACVRSIPDVLPPSSLIEGGETYHADNDPSPGDGIISHLGLCCRVQ